MKLEIDYLHQIVQDDVRPVLRKDNTIAFYENKLILYADNEVITVVMRAKHENLFQIKSREQALKELEERKKIEEAKKQQQSKPKSKKPKLPV